ncbi:hypothetical protein PtA15_17A27 [Puccinia triticina]|nr:uncharacterized protein PtA15_17A27 [Puccinia triticina]WAQ92546.1 hypothetical protein PtA15_17A27 [Puccinia triticina]
MLFKTQSMAIPSALVLLHILSTSSKRYPRVGKTEGDNLRMLSDSEKPTTLIGKLDTIAENYPEIHYKSANGRVKRIAEILPICEKLMKENKKNTDFENNLVEIYAMVTISLQERDIDAKSDVVDIALEALSKIFQSAINSDARHRETTAIVFDRLRNENPQYVRPDQIVQKYESNAYSG